MSREAVNKKVSLSAIIPEDYYNALVQYCDEKSIDRVVSRAIYEFLERNNSETHFHTINDTYSIREDKNFEKRTYKLTIVDRNTGEDIRSEIVNKCTSHQKAWDLLSALILVFSEEDKKVQELQSE